MKKLILILVFTMTSMATLMVSILWGHEESMHVAENLQPVTWGFQGTGSFFNMHPIFVHFPLALFPAAFFFYVIGIFLRKNHVLAAGRWTLWLATSGAVAAVLTGILAGNYILHNDEVHQIMAVHQKLSFVVLGAGVTLSVWALILNRKPQALPFLFLILLGGLNLVLAQQADFGGRMVYLKGAGVRASAFDHEEPRLLDEAGEHVGHDT